MSKYIWMKPRIRMHAGFLFLILAVLAACGTRQAGEGAAKQTPAQKLPLPKLDPQMRKELTTYLESHHQSPEDYVVSKFKDHDIVFIGEYHRIKQNVELIQRLIPLLYAAGVHDLGMEFSGYAEREDIEKLITAPAYDEELAKDILFRDFIFWGYQEYADIFKTAWALNHSLPEGAPRVRVIGLGFRSDWSFIKKEGDREDPEIMKRVWPDGDPDIYMADVITKEYLDKGKKALIYAGNNHAFTRYRQPIYNEMKKKFDRFGDTRMGNAIYNKIGDRAFNIFLHASWPNAEGYGKPYVYPVDGVIDALMRVLDAKDLPAAFDVPGTPFGELQAKSSLNKYGYEGFTLKDYCDGYIIQCFLSQYQGVTPIKDFINEKNLEKAKEQSPSLKFRGTNITAKDFNKVIAGDTDMNEHFGHLY